MFPRTPAGKPKRSTELKRLLDEGPHPIVGVTGATAQQAQIAASAGFRLFGISGAHTSATWLGLPDAGLLTLTELLDNTRRICDATTLPVQVDCDTGFGNAIAVSRTVESMIRAGAASMFLEDQASPKRCGYAKGKELVSVEEAAGKLRAACAVRDALDPDFTIFARTDARGAVGGGMEEVLKRGAAYLETGVDVLYVEALQSRDEIRALRAAFPKAKLRATLGGNEAPLTKEEHRQFGLVTMSLHIGVVAAIAVHDFLHRYASEGESVMREFAERAKSHPLGGFRVFDLAGFPQIAELEERFLPKETLARREASIGEYDPAARKKAS